MKNLIIFIFLNVPIVLFSQINWCGFFCASPIELTFDGCVCNNFILDTLSDTNNIWQIGQPQKVFFNQAYSPPNAIVTDLINPYPVNNNSTFNFKNISNGGYCHGQSGLVSLSGYYKTDMDSLKDYCTIRFSPDNGNTWIDLLHDSIFTDYYDWEAGGSEKPILTGTTDDWKWFYVLLTKFGEVFNIQSWDTIIFNFTFISDNIFDNKDGIMFDNLQYSDAWEAGINENQINSFIIYPNPASDYLTIKSNSQAIQVTRVNIYNTLGELLIIKFDRDLNNINLKGLNSGVYYLKIISDKNSFNSKFIVKK